MALSQSNGRPSPPAPAATTSALELRGVTAGYGQTTVLREVDVEVPTGAVVALLGPNGAGKTTLLRTAAGLVRPARGEVRVAGEPVTTWAPHRRAQRGLCLIPEGRGIFRSLTVRDNLAMQVPPWSRDSEGIARGLTAFPELEPRLGQVAGSLSGGEQQMLALCRAWIARPRIVMLDEVSMGLAPRIVDKIFAALRQLTESGTTVLMVEQFVTRALEIADRVYLLEKGSIAFSGAAGELDRDTVLSRYLGLDGA